MQNGAPASVDKENIMSKSEWEIVDEARQPQQPPFYGQAEPAGAQAQQQVFMRAVLGRWWKWKAAILILLAACILIVFAAFTSVVFMVLATVAFISLGMKKFRLWLRPAQQPNWHPMRK